MTQTYFAQITDGIVTNVAVVSKDFLDANPERYTGTWVETFWNKEGKQYASIGMAYDGIDFYAPQPFASWILDSNKHWQPPTPKPDGRHEWNEAELAWVAI